MKTTTTHRTIRSLLPMALVALFAITACELGVHGHDDYGYYEEYPDNSGYYYNDDYYHDNTPSTSSPTSHPSTSQPSTTQPSEPVASVPELVSFDHSDGFFSYFDAKVADILAGGSTATKVSELIALFDDLVASGPKVDETVAVGALWETIDAFLQIGSVSADILDGADDTAQGQLVVLMEAADKVLRSDAPAIAAWNQMMVEDGTPGDKIVPTGAFVVETLDLILTAADQATGEVWVDESEWVEGHWVEGDGYWSEEWIPGGYETVWVEGECYDAYLGDECTTLWFDGDCYQTYLGEDCDDYWVEGECWDEYAGQACEMYWLDGECMDVYAGQECEMYWEDGWCEDVWVEDGYWGEICVETDFWGACISWELDWIDGGYWEEVCYDGSWTEECWDVYETVCQEGGWVEDCWDTYETVCSDGYWDEVCDDVYGTVCDEGHYEDVCTEVYGTACDEGGWMDVWVDGYWEDVWVQGSDQWVEGFWVDGGHWENQSLPEQEFEILALGLDFVLAFDEAAASSCASDLNDALTLAWDDSVSLEEAIVILRDAIDDCIH